LRGNFVNDNSSRTQRVVATVLPSIIIKGE